MGLMYDLYELTIKQVEPHTFLTGTVTLTYAEGDAADKVRFFRIQEGEGEPVLAPVTLPVGWETPGGLHQMLWIQGVSVGSTTIELHYDPDGQHVFKDTIKLNVFEVDLDMEGVSDEGELDPGAFVAVNDDDDNGNGSADKDDTGIIAGEDDLVKIVLDVHKPEGVTVPGNVTLVREMGGNKINVWTSDRCTSAGSKLTFNGEDNVFAVSSLPLDLWVEGNAVSSEQRDIRLALRHTNVYVTQRDQVCVTVLKVDLDIANVADQEEENPGGFVGVNDDDDNDNGTADKDETGTVSGEDDLVAITLQKVLPTDLTGSVTLSASAGSAKVKVWQSSTKGTQVSLPESYDTPGDLPKTLYVEGVATSGAQRDVELKLEYTVSETTHDDKVRLTVVAVDLDIAGVDDNAEESPGGYVLLNSDDDNGNGTPDKDETGTVSGEDDLVAIMVRKVLPTDLTGPVTLSASAGAYRVKLWQSSTKGVEVDLPKTYNTPGDLPKTVYVEGVVRSLSERDIELTLSYSKEGTTHEDRVRVTVLEVDLLEAGLDAVEAGGENGLRKDGADTWTNDTYSTNGDRQIEDPIWMDANLDDQPEKEDPVSYVKGKRPEIVYAKLNIAPALANAAPAKVKVDAVPSGAGGGSGERPENVTFGPVDVDLTGATVYIMTGLTASGTAGSVVNNFSYDMSWKISLDGGTSWSEFQTTTHKVFVTDTLPEVTYCSDVGLNYDWSSLFVTAKRMDWATTAGEGEAGNDLPAQVANYIHEHPGFGSAYYSNPFSHLDAGCAGDCISLANLAATALRLVGTDAGPRRAHPRNVVDANDSDTWGWTYKMHPYRSSWSLCYPGNYFEGFFYVGTLNLYTNFPEKAWTVAPRRDIAAAAGKEKYLPLYVLQALPVTTLYWLNGEREPDVEWKPGDSISGVALEDFGASWPDPADDGEYQVQWDHENSRLRLADGSWVDIPNDGGYTLTCTKGSIEVNVVKSNLPGADDTGTARIVPARTLASIP